MVDPLVILGLVLAQPEQLRGGEAGECTVAGQLDQAVEADQCFDLGALGLGPLVIP